MPRRFHEQYLQSGKELLEEVGGYGSAVLRCAADVIDRAGFGEHDGPSGCDVCGSDGFPGEETFRLGQARGIFAQAGGADADVLDVLVLYERDCRYCNLGDCLSVTRADFANVCFVTI